MISKKTATELRGIASSGGGLEVDGSRYTATELRGIATMGKTSGANLIVNNSDKLTATEMRGIASCNSGNVSFK